MQVKPTDALVIVDVQNTFCPGGTLPVANGDEVVAPLNRVMPLFASDHVFATQDWHPNDHCSFAARGGPWPPHAVQNTPDADLHPGLDRSRIAAVIQKGTTANRDAYSGFDGTHLAERLRALNVGRVFVGGLATDYCVKATALDAREAGFDAIVLEDACRAVNVSPGDGERALAEMEAAGCRVVLSGDLSGDEERARRPV
jgi:nicotinamidase/pyrazinamidase